MAKKHPGFDGKKRWGNSGIEGVGVNSPDMMKARAGFKKKEADDKFKNNPFAKKYKAKNEARTNALKQSEY